MPDVFLHSCFYLVLLSFCMLGYAINYVLMVLFYEMFTFYVATVNSIIIINAQSKPNIFICKCVLHVYNTF